MTYCFDLDNTICSEVKNSRYEDAIPRTDVIQEINTLYNNGNIIIIMTARGCRSGIDNTELTKKQLTNWNVKYHDLIMNKKPHADYFIDDKGVNIDDWRKTIPTVRGILAGSFDVIHPGYIEMFKDAKNLCNRLTVALHEDPSVERSHKLTPVQTVEERAYILKSIKYVDNVITYKTEQDYINILESGVYDVRFLGTDYKNKTYTGKHLKIKIEWLDREHHDYSSTKLKTKIYESVKSKIDIDYD